MATPSTDAQGRVNPCKWLTPGMPRVPLGAGQIDRHNSSRARVYVNDNFGDFTAQFSETPVADLLNRLGTERVILTDQVTEQCILYSALDAYVRHFQVVVPTDGVAHIDPDLGAAALNMMEQNMSAELTTAADCLC